MKELVEMKAKELMDMDPTRCPHNARAIARSWAKLQKKRMNRGTQGFKTEKFANLKNVKI